MTVTERRIMRLIQRDGVNCHLCRLPIFCWWARAKRERFHNLAPSIDHVIPRALGGRYDLANLRLAHRWCNTYRGTAPIASFPQSAERWFVAVGVLVWVRLKGYELLPDQTRSYIGAYWRRIRALEDMRSSFYLADS